MTREEQIKQAAQRATNYGSNCNNYAYLSFIEGAEWADGHPNGNVIRWQTGEPTEEGEYLVQLKYGHIRIINWEKFNGYCNWLCFNKDIIAWCPLSEIKPYKEV